MDQSERVRNYILVGEYVASQEAENEEGMSAARELMHPIFQEVVHQGTIGEVLGYESALVAEKKPGSEDPERKAYRELSDVARDAVDRIHNFVD